MPSRKNIELANTASTVYIDGRRRIHAIVSAITIGVSLSMLAACTTSTALTKHNLPNSNWTKTSASGTSTPTTPGDPNQERSGEPGAAPRDTTQSTAPENNGRSSAIRLGTLTPSPSADEVEAPFDPCTVVSWTDLPEQLRPRAAKPPRPSPRAPQANSTFDIACVLEINTSTTIKVGSPSSPSGGPSGQLSAWIVWGRDLPVVLHGATPTTIGGAQGSVLKVNTNAGDPMCTGTAQLRSGVVGISIANGRAPELDTCDLVTDLLTRITAEHA